MIGRLNNFMLFIFLMIFAVSFIMALRSMRDYHLPDELKAFLNSKKIKGSIVFFKNKTVHYRSKK